MKPEHRILVVDDHTDIRAPLCEYLEQNGFDARGAALAEEARAMLAGWPADLIVLDVMMPNEDGLSFCRWLRSESETPVLFLSARTGEVDRILGLEMGGDDYMAKPFNPRELLARVRSILKRVHAPPPGTPGTGNEVVRFERWEFHRVRRELLDENGVVVSLGLTGARLLSAFLESPKKVLSRDALLERIRGDDAGMVFDRAIDTQVSRLRRLLERNPEEPALIQTCWGEGYVFTADVQRG